MPAPCALQSSGYLLASTDSLQRLAQFTLTSPGGIRHLHDIIDTIVAEGYGSGEAMAPDVPIDGRAVRKQDLLSWCRNVGRVYVSLEQAVKDGSVQVGRIKRGGDSWVGYTRSAVQPKCVPDMPEPKCVPDMPVPAAVPDGPVEAAPAPADLADGLPIIPLAELDTAGVEALLAELKLSRYAPEFARLEISGADLEVALDSDLLEMGVSLSLHRRRLLARLQQLRATHPPTTIDPLVDDASSPSGEDDNLCVVCLQAPRVCALLPCGHRCLCHGCASNFSEPAKGSPAAHGCPMCRGEVAAVQRIYD